MKITYNKLVRDQIPEIIREAGKAFLIEPLGEAEYEQALRQKLQEEAQEVGEAKDKEAFVKEIADLYEVIDALITHHALDKAAVLATQEKRRATRGGFEKRLLLAWVEEE